MTDPFEPHQFERGPQLVGTPTGIVRGRDVAAIGFIPHTTEVTGLHAYDSYAGRQFDAIQRVFQSGNYIPDPAIDSPMALANYLVGRKEYRGATLLADVKLACCDDEPVSVSFNTLAEQLSIGFTPLQYFERHLHVAPPGSLQWGKRVLHWSRGVRQSELDRVKVAFDSGCVEIELLEAFRICWSLNAAGQVLYGMPPAPYVWIQLRYRICCNRCLRASISNSDIPSFYVYRDWSHPLELSMLGKSRTELDDFFGAFQARPHGLAPSSGIQTSIF